MQLMNVQDDLREQSVFKERETQATSREESAITVIFQNTSHENVENKRNHKALLLSNENSEI